jgi:hypothetical protein
MSANIIPKIYDDTPFMKNIISLYVLDHIHCKAGIGDDINNNIKFAI